MSMFYLSGRRMVLPDRGGAWRLAMIRLGVPVARSVLAGLLIVFFGFVGFMKACAPMQELALHHAWVVVLPVALARLVGWSELVCAAGLISAIYPTSGRAVAR